MLGALRAPLVFPQSLHRKVAAEQKFRYTKMKSVSVFLRTYSASTASAAAAEIHDAVCVRTTFARIAQRALHFQAGIRVIAALFSGADAWSPFILGSFLDR